MEARTPDVISVAVTRVDGGLNVLRVVTVEYVPDGTGGRVVHRTFDPTPEHIGGLIAKRVNAGLRGWTGDKSPVSWRVVPNDFVDDLTNRTFRNAWKDDGSNKPGHDMPKARAIHMDRIRIERDKELERLDKEYMLALEQNDVVAQRAVAAQKRALRDLPITFDLTIANTPEDLYNLWPVELPARVP